MHGYAIHRSPLQSRPSTPTKNASPSYIQDNISAERARTLDGLFAERVHRSPQHIAYRHFEQARDTWVDLTRKDMEREVSRWQAGLGRERGCPEFCVNGVLVNAEASCPRTG
jgi:long-chain acyl-CoA synthetase